MRIVPVVSPFPLQPAPPRRRTDTVARDACALVGMAVIAMLLVFERESVPAFVGVAIFAALGLGIMPP